MKYILSIALFSIILASCSTKTEQPLVIPWVPVIQSWSTQVDVPNAGSFSTGIVSTGSIVAKVRTLWTEKDSHNNTNIILLENWIKIEQLTTLAKTSNGKYPWCGRWQPEKDYKFIEYSIISGSGLYWLIKKELTSCKGYESNNATTYFGIDLKWTGTGLIDMNDTIKKQVPIDIFGINSWISTEINIQDKNKLSIKVFTSGNDGQLFKKWWWKECGGICQAEAYIKEFDFRDILTQATKDNIAPIIAPISFNGKYILQEKNSYGGVITLSITIQDNLIHIDRHETDYNEYNIGSEKTANGKGVIKMNSANTATFELTEGEEDGGGCSGLWDIKITNNTIIISRSIGECGITNGTYKKQ